MSEDQNRSEFEAWMVNEGYGAKPRICSVGSPCEGEYADQYWHRSWVAWQASRRTYRASVLEEAAKVCEDMRDEGGDDAYKSYENNHDDGHMDGCNNCAAAIRALAQTQEGQEP